MANGHKDWDVPISISAQELDAITNRPKYGAAQRAVADLSVSTPSETPLITVSGRGMIYSGFITLVSTAQHNLDGGVLRIDGSLVSFETMSDLNSAGVFNPGTYPFYLVKYDPVNFVYTQAMFYGVTFESLLAINWVNTSANAVIVKANLVYALTS